MIYPVGVNGSVQGPLGVTTNRGGNSISATRNTAKLTPLQRARKSSLHSHAVEHNRNIAELENLPTRQELVDHANEWYFGNHKLIKTCQGMMNQIDADLMLQAKAAAKRQRTGFFSFAGGGTLQPFDIELLVPIKDAVATFYHRFSPEIDDYIHSMQIVDSHEPGDNPLSRWLETDKDDKHEKALRKIVNGLEMGIDVDRPGVHVHKHKQWTRGLKGVVDDLETQYRMAMTLLAKANGQSFDFNQLPELVQQTTQSAQDYITRLSNVATTWGTEGNAVHNESLNKEAHQAQAKLLVELEQIEELLKSAGVSDPASHVESLVSLLKEEAEELHGNMADQVNIEAIKERDPDYVNDSDVAVGVHEINQLISSISQELHNLSAVASVSMPMAEADKEVEKKHKKKFGKNKGEEKAVQIKETYGPADKSVKLLKKLKSKLKAIIKELESYREGGRDGGAVGRLSALERNFRVRQGERYGDQEREVTVHLSFNKPGREGITKQQAFY